MRSLFFDGRLPKLCERAVPKPEAGEALVRVSLAGVCNTDLEIAKGYMGFRGILGHEFVGQVSSGPAEWLHRRVVAEINFACGHCMECAQDLGRHCGTRRVMGILNADGAFADYVAVPVANLHPVPDNMADEEAVFIEPLAAALEILDQRAVNPGERCAVLGDGKLGLLIAQVLQRAGAQVLAVGKHPAKLEILAQRGIAIALEDQWEPEAGAFDLVVEATGSAAGLQRAIALTRPRGSVLLKSTVAQSTTIDWAPVVINELQILGSRCGRFEPALEALGRGEIEVRALISDRIPLDRAETALRGAGQREALKVLIDCRSEPQGEPC